MNSRFVLIVMVIFSGGASTLLGKAFLDREHALKLLPIELAVGENLFGFFDNETCFGYARIKLTRNSNESREQGDFLAQSKNAPDGGISISLDGHANLSIIGQVKSVEISGMLEFSDLLHLGASILRAKMDGVNFGFGTKNIDPIELIAWYSDKSEEKNRQRWRSIISGPVEIFEIKKNIYNLKYKFFRYHNLSKRHKIKFESLKNLKVDIIQDEIAQNCNNYFEISRSLKEGLKHINSLSRAIDNFGIP